MERVSTATLQRLTTPHKSLPSKALARKSDNTDTSAFLVAGVTQPRKATLQQIPTSYSQKGSNLDLERNID